MKAMIAKIKGKIIKKREDNEGIISDKMESFQKDAIL